MPIAKEELPLTHEQIDHNIACILKKLEGVSYNTKRIETEKPLLERIQRINAALRQGMVLAWYKSLGYQVLKQIHVRYDEDAQGNWGYRCDYEVDVPFNYGNGVITPFTPMVASELGDFLQQVNAGHGHRHKILPGDHHCVYCGQYEEDIEAQGHEHVFLPGSTWCYYCDVTKE